MLAVLVLSAITAIVFSMATIVVIEIRSSGDALRTEPALYATLGVTEEALFQYRRNAGTPGTNYDVPSCLPANKNVCAINNVALVSSLKQFDESPRVQLVRQGEIVKLPIYVPQSFGQQYGSVKVTILNTGSGESVAVSINETDLSNATNVRGSASLNDAGVTTFEFTTFNSSATSQYDLVLDNADAAGAVSVSIETTGPDGAKKGLPFLDQKVLKIGASYLGLTRTYTVRIPE